MKSATPQIARVGSSADQLGESPLWDVHEQALYWIDVEARILRRRAHVDGAVREWQLPQRVGSIALCGSDRAAPPTGALAVLVDGVYRLDFRTGHCQRVADTEGDNPRTQFNDGKVDRVGRFVFGSMRCAAPDEGLGFMYRIDASYHVATLDGGFSLFNGPCFSPDGRTLYYADTRKQMIWAADYDPLGGIARKRVFADLRPLDALPDGATVDAEGCLWSALLMSGQLGRFSPDGELMQRVDLPVRRPTSVAFGGPDLDILYVTSAGMRAEPGDATAGWLLAIQGLGVRGIAEARFTG
jgi:L-arabinonolactonase